MMMHEHALSSPALSLRHYGAVSACDVHAFHQIVLGVDGSMEMAVDGIGHRIDARHAWLIPAGARHEYAGIGENRQLVLDVPCASLALPERLFSRSVPLTMNEALAGLVREASAYAARVEAAAREHHRIADSLGNAGNENEPRAAQLARRLSWDTAVRLAALLGESVGVETPASGLDYGRIDKWLRAHLSEPLRVADLAVYCGFGERRFAERGHRHNSRRSGRLVGLNEGAALHKIRTR